MGCCSAFFRCISADVCTVLRRLDGQLLFAGDPNIKGELMKFVVAEDLFNLCNIEFQPASLAVKRAILKWAGSDQAGAVQLVKCVRAVTPHSAQFRFSMGHLKARTQGCVLFNCVKVFRILKTGAGDMHVK